MPRSMTQLLIALSALALLVGCSSSPEEQPQQEPTTGGASQAFESATAAQQAQEPDPVTDDDLAQLAAVIDALMEREAELREEDQSYEQRLARAESPREVQQIQHEYMSEMADAALSQGMSLEEFTELGQRIQEDAELRGRLSEFLDEEQVNEFFGVQDPDTDVQPDIQDQPDDSDAPQDTTED